jgi:hypothetical protein
MPAPRSKKHERLSRVRQLFDIRSNQEKFISWHPEKYGFDRATYTAVVVVMRGGKTEVHPARSSEEAHRIYRIY